MFWFVATTQAILVPLVYYEFKVSNAVPEKKRENNKKGNIKVPPPESRDRMHLSHSSALQPHHRPPVGRSGAPQQEGHRPRDVAITLR